MTELKQDFYWCSKKIQSKEGRGRSTGAGEKDSVCLLCLQSWQILDKRVGVGEPESYSKNRNFRMKNLDVSRETQSCGNAKSKVMGMG